MDESNRIILIEDDLSLLERLTYALEKKKFSVIIARTVKNAIDSYLYYIKSMKNLLTEE